MRGRILVAYASRYGSTREVADIVGEVLAAEGQSPEVRDVAEVRSLDGYDGVVLGSGLYTGRIHKDARRFLRRRRGELSEVPLAIFALGPRHDTEAELESSRKQVEAALAHVPELEPVSVEVFGGVVNPARLPFPLNRMEPSDARDWDAIRRWARGLVRLAVVA